MFSQVLDCPKCGERFHYEHGENFPAQITCPACLNSSSAREFSAVTFCPECRSKLKVPLSILNNKNNFCPHCRTRLSTENPNLDDDTLGGKNSSAASKRMLNDGELFDKYRIIRLLGKGGMAEVYLAEHLLLKQLCALKLMQRSMETEDQIFAKRFIREAKLTHQFTHPNIVKVFDAGSDFKTGYLFLAMEYIEGKTLLDLSRERQLTEMDLLSVLSAMTSALGALYEAKVVHRDIKPSNIMLGNDGVYKLMDLGIAKSDSRTAGEMTLTMERTTIGTPGYASPEQCRSAHTVDCRSDIYSLGATLYHAASGTVPFDGDTPVEIILKVMQQEPEPLRNLRPDLSHSMLSLIEKMMAKKPDNRPSAPAEILEILSGSQDDAFAKLKHSLLTFCIKHLKEINPERLNGLLLAPLIGGGKLLMAILEAGSSLLKKLNLAAFSNFLVSFIAKLIRLAVIIVLTVFAGTVLMYFANKNVRETQNFKDYALSLIGKKKPPKEEIKTQDSEQQESRKELNPLASLHPLVKYPDLNGEKRSRLWSKNGRIAVQFPEITFKSKDTWNIVADYDFSKNVPEGNFKHTQIKEKILTVTGTPEEPCKLRLPRSVYEDKFTFSADLLIGEENKCTVLKTDPVSICVAENKLSFCFPGGYYVQTQLTPQQGKWFNIAFSIEREKRRFTVFSGNCLLGVYLLPDGLNQPLKDVVFYDKSTQTHFSGKISRLTIYSCARSYEYPAAGTFLEAAFTDGLPAPAKIVSLPSAPAPQKPLPVQTASAPQDLPAAPAESAPEPLKQEQAQNTEDNSGTPEKTVLKPAPVNVPLPAPRYYGGIRTVDIRRRENDERQRKIRNLPDSDIKKETLAYIERQQRELANQRGIQRSVDLAASKHYTHSKTLYFKRVAESFFYSLDGQKNWSQHHYRTSESLLSLLAGNVDPNITVRYKKSSNELITLGDAVARGLLRPQEKFIERLIWKKFDVNKTNSPLPLDLIFFGKNNVDEGYPPLIFSIASRREHRTLSNHYYSPEIVYNEKDLCRFLLLCPKINGLTDPAGKTLLHLAAERDHADFARDLLLAGFTAGQEKDKQEQTPWQIALRRGNERVLKVLEKFNLQTPCDAKDKVQFEFCGHVRKGNADQIADCLVTGANASLPWANELDALQNACLLGKIKSVESLLKNNVDPNKFNKKHPYSSPLQIAVLKGDAPLLALLLKYGARPDDSQNFTASPNLTVFILSRVPHDKTPYTILELLETVVKHDKNWDANRPVAGKSLLYHCLSTYSKHAYTKRKVVEFLLKHKADPETKDIENMWLSSDIKRLLDKR